MLRVSFRKLEATQMSFRTNRMVGAESTSRKKNEFSHTHDRDQSHDLEVDRRKPERTQCTSQRDLEATRWLLLQKGQKDTGAFSVVLTRLCHNLGSNSGHSPLVIFAGCTTDFLMSAHFSIYIQSEIFKFI